MMALGQEQDAPAWRRRLQRVIGSDFVQKVAETFSTRILLILISLVTSVIVARKLGPEGRGLYALASATAALGVQFGTLGLHASNTYYVASDRTLLPRLVANSLGASLLLGGGGAGLAGALIAWRPDLAPVHSWLLILALIWVPLGLAYQLLQNLLIGIHEVRAYNRIELTTKLMVAGFIGLAIALRAVQVETVFAAGLAAVGIGVVWVLRALRPHVTSWERPSLDLLRTHVRYGFKAYLSALFAFLVLRIDLFLVQRWLGAQQAGYYSIAVTLADMVYMLPVVIGSMLFPKLAAETDPTRRWHLAKRATWLTGGLMGAGALVAAIISGPLIRLMYGAAFAPAAAPFIWLLPGIVLLSINTILMNYFAAQGMPMVTLLSPLVATLVNVFANWQLIPRLGLIGASLASVAAYGMMLVASGIHLHWRSKETLA